jgi:hypothetical protein
MAWLVRDLGDGSIVGVLVASKKPTTPSGFEATYAEVVSDDGGDVLLLNDDCSKVGIGAPSHSSIDFTKQHDAEVWRVLDSFLDWKNEWDERD